MKIAFMLFLLVIVVIAHVLCDSITQPRRHHYQHEYHRNAQERRGHHAPRNLEDGLIETALNRKQNNIYEGGDHKSFQPSKLAKSSLNNMTKEQKERLLNLLESKIKEIKKESIFIDGKSERQDSPALVLNKLVSSDNEMPQNIDLDFNVNGVGSIGNAVMRVHVGSEKENYIKMKASGIASLGESEISIGLVDSKLKLPGLSEMFAGIPKRGNLEIPKKIAKAPLLRTSQVFLRPNIRSSNNEEKNYVTVKYDQVANRGDDNGFSKGIDVKNTDKNKSDKTVTAESVDNLKSWEDKANDSGISNGAETIDKKIKDNATVRSKYLTRTDQQDETRSNLANIEKNEKSKERSVSTDQKESTRADEDRSKNNSESEKPMWTADETIKIMKNKEVESEMPNDKILNENQEHSLKETATGSTQ